MTYSEIRSFVDDILGSQSVVSDDTMLAWANQAVKELVSDTECLEKRQAMLAVADQQEYSYPTDCKKLRRVAFDGTVIDYINLFSLQNEAHRWDEDAGDPRKWFAYGLNESFGVWPIPATGTVTEVYSGTTGSLIFGALTDGMGVIVDTADGSSINNYGAIVEDASVESIAGRELDVFYFAEPPDMTGDDDEPDLPGWAHPYVAYFMLREVYKTSTQLKDPMRAAYWGSEYNHGKNRIRVRTNGRLPREWRLKPRVGVRAPYRYGRLPQVVDTSE